jgi:hypothetical protein
VRARHPRVVDYRLTGGEALLLHLDSGEYHELNPVGAAIWELVDGRRSVSEITEALRQRVEGPPEELTAIVSAFLDDLLQRDLLT